MGHVASTEVLFAEIFSDKGLLKKTLSFYENRLDQQKMAEQIWEAFTQKKSGLFEAGTGIGKSLAYLIPALLWSHQTGEKIVISTYTISLQEQLLEKDVPLLLQALGLKLQVVLAKGMGNYLCLRKMEETGEQQGEALQSWAHKTADGSRSSLSFALPQEVWGKVQAEADNCLYVKCPHYKQCFFFKARAQVQDADVIIVNHHLLMAHLLSDEKQPILPPFTRLILDEAHHLEHVARSCLAQTLDRIELFRFLARVHSDLHPEVSRFLYLQDVLKDKGSAHALQQRLSLDLPGEKREIISKINEAFDLLDENVRAQATDTKWRLTPSIFQSRQWQERIIPAFQEVKTALKRYAASLDSLVRDIENLRLEEIKSKIEGALGDISAVTRKINETISIIEKFFSETGEELVRFAERTEKGSTLTLAHLDVSPFLQEKLFQPLQSAILCSATLATSGNFDHIIEHLGLTPEKLIKEIYPSPFDFKNRTKLLSFSDLPPPTAYDFITEASKVIVEAIHISGGGAFVLFTSYDMLNKCYEKVAPSLKGISLCKQGEGSRHLLLEDFKRKKNSVLFGADSFWEGVDVAGEALRLVIIVKLPFPVPSDPLLQARAEFLKKEGRDAFLEDSIPQAVVKFKQGFGRLMRRKEDRGCVLCLDQRLFGRVYGKKFLQSLPECVTSYNTRKNIFQEMQIFYKNCH